MLFGPPERPKRQESHIRSLLERPKRKGSAGGGGSCDCLLGSRGDPKCKNHISVLSGRDPKGKVLPGGGSCDCRLGSLGDPKGKNHISILSGRDPKGKVPSGEVVAIARWAPGETQEARITHPFSPGETRKARFCRGNELRLPFGAPEVPKRQGSPAHSRHQTLVVWWFWLFFYGFRCFGCCW